MPVSSAESAESVASASSALPPPDAVAATWIRTVMAVFLAAPQLLTGAWAILRPAGWFADFPGIGPAIVAAEPPFNRHLATDAGAGFLAIGACLLAAAIFARVPSCRLALLTYLVFEVPHAAYHVGHRVDALSGITELLSASAILSGVAVALVLLWVLQPRRSPGNAGRSSALPTAASAYDEPTAGAASPVSELDH